MSKTMVKDSQDIILQDLMNDIVRGARSKMVDPVLDENKKLAKLLEDLQDSSRKELESIKERLDSLEEAVRAMPLLLLNAIREAISQAGIQKPDTRATLKGQNLDPLKPHSTQRLPALPKS